MKLNKSNFDLMSAAGGMLGGVVAKFVEKFTVSDDQENNYLTIAVQAGAGAAISAFVNNRLIKAAGAGMLGVAGYNLGRELQLGEETTTTTKTDTETVSGIGLLPGQLAIGNAMNMGQFNASKRVAESVEVDNRKKSNVQ